MKSALAALATAIAISSFAQTNAPIDNFSVVTNLWYEGHKSDVLAIGEQRLAANSNDMAGIIIRMEYDLSFMNAENYSNGILRALEVSQTITNEHFAKGKVFF
jgi:hypothetical protein